MKKLWLLLLLVPGVGLADVEGDKPQVLGTPNGRYVFGQVGPVRADQYMLDVKTGRLWAVRIDKEGVPFLQVIPYLDDSSRSYVASPEYESLPPPPHNK